MERSKFKKVGHPRRREVPSSSTSTTIHYIVTKCLIIKKMKKKKINDLIKCPIAQEQVKDRR